MKTAVSIPDDVFQKAERLARRMKKSRSELFSNALAEYVARHAPDHVTERMNQVCAEIGLDKPTRSFLLRPGAFWSAANGDFSGRDLVGRSSGPRRVWARLPQTGSGCAGRLVKPQSNSDGCLRSANEQPEVGQCSRQRHASGAVDGASKGLGRQRLTDCQLG